MADIKITDLAGYTNPVSTDVLPIVDVGSDLTKKVSIADLLENAGTGSASAPSFSFDGDNDTGIYRPGANQVAISTGGTERMRIDSSGNVDIYGAVKSNYSVATASLAAYINSAGGLYSYYLGSGAGVLNAVSDNSGTAGTLILSTGSEKMRITSTGNVGIGTSSPTARLDVATAGNDETPLKLYGAAGGANRGFEITLGTNSGIANSSVKYDAITSSGQHIWLTNGSEKARIGSNGKVGIGVTTPGSKLEVNGNIGIGRVAGGYTFRETVGGSERAGIQSNANNALIFNTGNQVEKVRIDVSGNVGIGTSAPVNPLHVEKSGSGLVASFRTGNANDGATIGLVNGSEAVGYLGDPSALGTGDTVNTNFAIRASQTRNITFVTGSSPTEKVRIDSSGRVGIGVTSPAANLHIKAASGDTKLRLHSADSGLESLDLTWDNTNNLADLRTNAAYPITCSTNQVERMRIDSDGRLLAGTSSSSAEASLILSGSSLTNLGDAVLWLSRGAQPSTTSAGVELGKIKFGDNDQNAAIEIEGERDGGTWTSGVSHPGRLLFKTTANGATTPTERMRITSAGNVGIGTSSPTSALHVYGNNPQVHCQHNTGIAGPAGFKASTAGGDTSANAAYYQMNGGSMWGQTGGLGIRFGPADRSTVNMLINTNNGKVGIGTASPSATLEVIGSATFSGAVSKGSGSFRIPHPLKAETHQLVHSFVEGPQADNIYRGKVDLVAGTAAVNIDTVAGMTEGTFVALNREIQCFTTNETGWTAIKGSVTGNVLTITAQENTCTDTISWLVIGERQDQHMYDTDWTDENGKVIVEPEKPVAASEAE